MAEGDSRNTLDMGEAILFELINGKQRLTLTLPFPILQAGQKPSLRARDGQLSLRLLGVLDETFPPSTETTACDRCSDQPRSNHVPCRVLTD